MASVTNLTPGLGPTHLGGRGQGGGRLVGGGPRLVLRDPPRDLGALELAEVDAAGAVAEGLLGAGVAPGGGQGGRQRGHREIFAQRQHFIITRSLYSSRTRQTQARKPGNILNRRYYEARARKNISIL